MLTKLRQKIKNNLEGLKNINEANKLETYRGPLREASTTGNTKPYVAGPLKADPPSKAPVTLSMLKDMKQQKVKELLDESRLYNYLFHYNHHTKRWAAFKRDDQHRYFNDYERHAKAGIIYAERFEDIVDFLTKK